MSIFLSPPPPIPPLPPLLSTTVSPILPSFFVKVFSLPSPLRLHPHILPSRSMSSLFSSSTSSSSSSSSSSFSSSSFQSSSSLCPCPIVLPTFSLSSSLPHRPATAITPSVAR
ncbi:hypothetical protein E2C01_096612 [Portunus trituberculatus]|uniref:Uncharacterized protein n=1 Tax=Portunus trituberculatus TaxID=210409 RepID=A0A5B7K274_PORTR|nr:hypothetical protein [Portunus trituberculatus]